MITLNGTEIKPTIFPDRTSQIWKIPESLVKTDNVVTWEFFDEGEIMHLAQLKALLDNMGVSVSLYLPYLPYARQDKPIANDRTFAFWLFVNILNAMCFTEVTILDPHNENAALGNICKVKVTYPLKQVRDVFYKTDCNLFCYPDEGARKKYTQRYPFEYNVVIHGEKHRNQQTGFIESYQIHGDPKGKKVLIVDDICDGGATFVYLAKALYDAGAEDVNLFVTHGIFSKGLLPLTNAGIRQIFTAEGEAVYIDKLTVGLKRYA